VSFKSNWARRKSDAKSNAIEKSELNKIIGKLF
jgi:hypothetical protein